MRPFASPADARASSHSHFLAAKRRRRSRRITSRRAPCTVSVVFLVFRTSRACVTSSASRLIVVRLTIVEPRMYVDQDQEPYIDCNSVCANTSHSGHIHMRSATDMGWRTRSGATPTAPSGSIPPAMRRVLATVSYSVLLLLVLAPAAMAENDGRGFYGATNDKVITEAGFILVIFFPTLRAAREPVAAPPGTAQGRAQGGAQSTARRQPLARRLVDEPRRFAGGHQRHATRTRRSGCRDGAHAR